MRDEKRIFTRFEFYAQMVQIVTGFSIIGYAIGKTVYDRVRRY
jgi:hypothetical protein